MHTLQNYNPPQTPWLEVLHVDQEILVLNKQSGLLSVPGKPESHKDCLEARAKQKYVGARTIHRLDMETSGVVVMARNKESQAHISKQFELRKTKKIYIARLAGLLREDTGEIDLPLICDWPNRPKQMVDHQQGKPALTYFTVLERSVDTTRVEFRPKTGRSHQLRVHALSIGHPILGDNLYGDTSTKEAAARLQLHAASLTLSHPVTGQEMTFNASIPF
jgi:tRNA pseudouridine32 synthase/23S rRNA pseudouridine746 synthase